jgi:hypothetical protein
LRARRRMVLPSWFGGQTGRSARCAATSLWLLGGPEHGGKQATTGAIHLGRCPSDGCPSHPLPRRNQNEALAKKRRLLREHAYETLARPTEKDYKGVVRQVSAYRTLAWVKRTRSRQTPRIVPQVGFTHNILCSASCVCRAQVRILGPEPPAAYERANKATARAVPSVD